MKMRNPSFFVDSFFVWTALTMVRILLLCCRVPRPAGRVPSLPWNRVCVSFSCGCFLNPQHHKTRTTTWTRQCPTHRRLGMATKSARFPPPRVRQTIETDGSRRRCNRLGEWRTDGACHYYCCLDSGIERMHLPLPPTTRRGGRPSLEKAS